MLGKLPLRLAALGALSITLVGGLSSPASAQDADPQPQHEGAPSSTQVGSADPKNVDAYIGVDCFGYSDVYKTSTDGGRANGRGRIICYDFVAELLDATDLFRLRWYGYQWLDSDTSQDYNDDGVVSISIWKCAGAGTYTYYSEATHRVKGYDGGYYTGYTSDDNRFSC